MLDLYLKHNFHCISWGMDIFMGDLEYKRVSMTLSIRGQKVLIQKIKILRMEEGKR